ncbi:MAG TPA: hypothetical protein G4O02_16965 [Caldilineae bacterium]|nr:hypothetical protein [Caldilineae bacterium]
MQRNVNSNKAITLREEETQVDLWDVKRLQQIAALLKKMVPNGERLSDGEALALAQAARILDRNPLVGELWAIPGKGVTDGYRGLIKDAKPGTYHLHYRPLTPQEIEEHEVRPSDIAKACELYLFEEMRQCREFSIPYEPTVGIGIVREEERYQTTRWDERRRQKVKLPRDQWHPIEPPTGRSWAWKAEIRAMKDALRRAGVQYVDREEVEELRRQAEALGVDTTGAESAPQILQLVDQHQALEESHQQRQEYLEATEANFGPEAREEVAKAVVDEDINDLFGEAEQAPVSDPQAEPPQFWGVPHAWVKRLVERANEVTDGYYRHLMHAENTLKREGFTQVTRANITQALQTLIVHAQKRMAERNRTEAPTDQPPQEQPPLLPDEEPEDHMTPDEPTDA